MSQGNDFATVRAYLDFWGEHPRRTKALTALGRIETALRVFADFAPPSWMKDDHPMTQGSPLAKRQVTAAHFRTAAARFEES